jgi:polyhydroxyalkanoate synthesis regulator phasin
VRDAQHNCLALSGGLTEITRQRAVTAGKALVTQGEATADQVSTLAEDLVTQTRQNSEAVAALVRNEVDRALRTVGLASVDDVTAALEARVRSLEETVRGLTGRGGEAPGKKAPAKKSAAKKAPAEKSAAPTRAGA